ncbi:cell division protein ZapC [Proteus mirabilis]|uniref:cell division protein ZapC n=1 Tax=Proteus mirabilis TaxID=584 RepID=UPI0034DD52F8
MIIKPDDRWRWYFDDEQQKLMLDLANGMIFRSRFPSKMLSATAHQSSPFTVDDAALYYGYDEQIRQIDMPSESRAELALNALIAHRFLKPLMPKSWYFEVSHSSTRPYLAQVVETALKDSNEKVLFLVVEVGEQACLCLLAQPQLALFDRTLTFCDPLKIMNDWLSEYHKQSEPRLFLYEKVI